MVAVDRQGPRALSVSLEAAFLDELTDQELDAVIAHELGHVWIFTHHPFLQTEQLANEIAMQVVSRQTLEAVYAKVRARGGHTDVSSVSPPALAERAIGVHADLHVDRVDRVAHADRPHPAELPARSDAARSWSTMGSSAKRHSPAW